jgi:hypothetical protein
VKVTVEALAAKVAKSVAYVYARCKLLALVPAGREAFLSERISAAHAVLIARLHTRIPDASGHVAFRMTSLLPEPLRQGGRDNDKKRTYVLQHIENIEYRTIACITREEAKGREKEPKANKLAYIFRTWEAEAR